MRWAGATRRSRRGEREIRAEEEGEAGEGESSGGMNGKVEELAREGGDLAGGEAGNGRRWRWRWGCWWHGGPEAASACGGGGGGGLRMEASR